MTDVELVIKIPEETYEYWKNHSHEYVLAEAIKNGIILPSGHGDLIDREELLKLPIDKANYPSNYVKYAQTIIEKDKEV
jgi:AMMECR1 domain-containing protein